MKKRLLICNEYTILVKEKEHNLLIEVNGDSFATVENATIDKLDSNKIVSLVINQYEKWAFGPIIKLKNEDYKDLQI